MIEKSETIFREMFSCDEICNEFVFFLNSGMMPTLDAVLDKLNETSWHDKFYLAYSIEDDNCKKHNLSVRINYVGEEEYLFQGYSLKEVLLSFYMAEKYNMFWNNDDLSWTVIKRKNEN